MYELQDTSTDTFNETGKTNRGHDFTLVKGQSRLDVRKYSFSQKTAKECYKWSADCGNSSSLRCLRTEQAIISRGQQLH